MKLKSIDVSELVQRVAEKEEKAFRELYCVTSAKLFTVGLWILKSRPDAEEALQESFIKIWAGAPSYQISKFSAMSWLIAVARNNALDRIRQRRPSGDDSQINFLVDNANDPEQNTQAAQEFRIMETRLSLLEPAREALVRGAYLEGLSYQQLADRTGLPINTVRTNIRRSLIAMRLEKPEAMSPALKCV